ncbi:MAG: pirin family protein [Proteobacteria bacterium]|nr:pirin family protein [Pseudomonadota bacterium]
MDQTVRQVDRLVSGMPTNDGAGVRLTRIIGQPGLSELDPFLLLDEFRSDVAGDYIAGFPDHPHRGFETVTYMLAGRMRHGDNQGNTGLLRPGSVQWMTAGRGIVHSEMPEQEDGLMWGFQLWINLPARDKMTEPRYQDVDPDAIRTIQRPDGSRIKIIAGRVDGIDGAVRSAATDPTYLDIGLPPGSAFRHGVPSDHAAFIYVFEGDARAGEGEAATQIKRGDLAVLSPGDTVVIAAESVSATRLLLVAAKPLEESIVRHGPFVMNTEAEIHQAIEDYRAGRF